MYGKITALVATTAIIVSTSAQAEGWQTSFSGGLSMSRTTFDLAPRIAATGPSEVFGGFLGFEGAGSAGGMSVSFDGFFEYLGDVDAVYETGPLHSGAIGLHVGQNKAAGYLGVFAGLGFFDSWISDAPEDAAIAGVEGSIGTAAGQAFVQLGYARAVSDQPSNDFIGPVARIGIGSDLPNGMSLKAAVEAGKKTDCVYECYFDYDPYLELTVEMQKDIAPGYGIVAGLNHFQPGSWLASTTGIYVGFTTAIGAGSKAPDTPKGAFKMAGWQVIP